MPSDPRGSPGRPEASLAPWILLPILAVVFLFVAFFAVPGPHCEADNYIEEASNRSDAVMVATVLGTLACVLAGLWRWLSASRRSPEDRTRTIGRMILALLGVAAFWLLWRFGAHLLGRQAKGVFEATFLLALVAAVIGLIFLVGSSTSGRGRRQAGVLLPGYLIGTGLLVCLPLGLVLHSFSEGTFCT